MATKLAKAERNLAKSIKKREKAFSKLAKKKPSKRFARRRPYG